MTYKINKLNTHKQQIVHANRLKLCKQNEADSIDSETDAHYQQLADNFDIVDLSQTIDNSNEPDDNVKARDATLVILEQIQRANNIRNAQEGTPEPSSEVKQTIDTATGHLLSQDRRNIGIENLGSIVQDTVRRSARTHAKL